MDIPDDVARSAGVPEDLDSSLLGPYTVPSPTRRRRAALVYLVGAALLAAAIPGLDLPVRSWVMVGLLVLVGVYHLAGAWEMRVADQQALDTANRAAGFPVGHASAAVGFDGWRSRPIWNVLVFSAEDPPARRGLVRVDAVDGTVRGVYVEDNPDT